MDSKTYTKDLRKACARPAWKPSSTNSPSMVT